MRSATDRITLTNEKTMNQLLPESGISRGIFNQPVTREMLHARTLELALMAGRSAHQIKQVDYERAKRELTGESDFDRQQAVLEMAG